MDRHFDEAYEDKIRQMIGLPWRVEFRHLSDGREMNALLTGSPGTCPIFKPQLAALCELPEFTTLEAMKDGRIMLVFSLPD
jgi:hypothetical protein